MKIRNINDISTENFNPIFINALRQYWRSTRSFQCIGNPKRQSLLLYLDGCRITYTDKSGEVFFAESGDVVYTPLGSEYRANLLDFISHTSHTVGINFFLRDEAGDDILLSDKITVFHPHNPRAVAALFDKAQAGDRGAVTLSNRITLLEILSELGKSPEQNENTIVADTIGYLKDHIEENPTVEYLAKRVGTSEVYLRRKFKETTGLSPLKYRNGLRLEKAASYLKFGDVSVQEISDMLAYSTVSHFIKEFKEHYGVSPLRYRKMQ